MDQGKLEKLAQAISDLIKPAFGSLEQNEKSAILIAVGKKVRVNLREEADTDSESRDVGSFIMDDGYIG